MRGRNVIENTIDRRKYSERRTSNAGVRLGELHYFKDDYFKDAATKNLATSVARIQRRPPDGVHR